MSLTHLMNTITKSSLALGAIALVGLTFPQKLHAQTDKTLTIYTYESFTADWGPGPLVKTAFEKQCDCTINYVALSDGVALLNRLRLEGKNTQADIVLGLDNNLITAAKELDLFETHGIDLKDLTIAGSWSDDTFVPFDYGYFAIVYDTQKIKTPPKSLKELFEGTGTQKIVIQDPRTSTPGLGLLLWAKKVYGDDAPKAWNNFKDRVLTVTPGWSEAYGLFTKGEAPMVLSYTTSPAYHIIAEETQRYQAASFSEGHYMQIEVAGITKKGMSNKLSKQFLEFMVSPAFQDIIPQTNWMLPVAPTSEPLSEVFDQLVKPTKALTFTPEEVAKNRKAWVDEWLEVMSQ